MRRGGRGGGWGRSARRGACLGFGLGPVCGRARRGREEGEAWSAVLYGGSLPVPRAKAAGTRGRGVPGDGAWHWDVCAPDTVSTPPIGSARALSSGASHPAPSPWVELGSTQRDGVLWCAEGAVTRRQWPVCLPKGTGKGEGCVSSTCAVCKCVVIGGKRDVGETWVSRSR